MAQPDKTVISADEFLKIIRFNYKGYYEYNKYYYQNNTVICENIEVTGSLIIDQIPNGVSIEFVNCKFTNVQLQGINSNYVLFKSTKLEKLSLNNAYFSTFRFDTDCKLNDEFKITSSFINRLEVDIPLELLHIKDCQRSRMTLILNSKVEHLLILNTVEIFIGGNEVITNCYLENTNYPFTSFAKIKSLRVAGCQADAYVSGVFEEIEIANSFICKYQWIFRRN